jgi:hypothetical protein
MVGYKGKQLWVNLEVPCSLCTEVLPMSGRKCLCCDLVTHMHSHNIPENELQ